MRYDHEIDKSGKLIINAQPPGPKWLRELIGVEYFTTVVVVNLPDIKVSGLSPLANLTKLVQLWLQDTQVSDLSPLAKLTNLENAGSLPNTK